MDINGTEHQPVAAHLWRFAREHDRLRSASNQLDAFLRELMDEATIKVYRIDSRAKSLDSYQKKAERQLTDGAPKYRTPATQIEDCIAARIIVFTNEARDRACERVKDVSENFKHHNPGVSKANGYDSEHFTISEIKENTPQLVGKSDLSWYLDTRPAFEVQLRTVAGHAWAEYEHDIRYKPSGYSDLPASVRERVDQLFTEAGGLRKHFDTTFSEIEKLLESSDATEESTSSEPDPIEEESEEHQQVPIDANSLSAFLSTQYPDAHPTRDDTLSWLEQIFAAIEFTTINDIEGALSNIDSDHVASLMDYQFTPTTARRLDDDLLAALGERYIESTGPGLGRNGRDRTQLLEWRLRRVKKKIFIYQITGDPRLDKSYLSASRAFREVVRLVADNLDPSRAVIDGAVALTEDGLPPTTRPRKISAEGSDLWVASNLGRSDFDDHMARLLAMLVTVPIAVRRAGETIARSAAFKADEPSE